MEGAIHQHRMCFDWIAQPMGVTMLRGFPDYPKDADAAPAALPYNRARVRLRPAKSNLRGTNAKG